MEEAGAVSVSRLVVQVAEKVDEVGGWCQSSSISRRRSRAAGIIKNS